MVGIPEDVIVEILLQLPVKALIRFRCVSKRWHNLIDSPNFVKSHWNLPNKPQFVMLMVFDKRLRIYFSELDIDYIENPSPNFKELTLPWRDEIFSNVSNFVGHCNGLLCFLCENYRGFLVLNPLTGKHIQVPPPPEQGCWWEAWGFGYDKDSDSYKVVALASYSFSGVVWIFSLKSSSWENIVDLPFLLFNGDAVFVDGALHWIACHDKEEDLTDIIFALHLGNSEHLSVPLPMDNSNNNFHLGVLDGCLCAISSKYLSDCYDLWVMKEYGLKESWTRLGTYYGDFNVAGGFNVAEFLYVGYGSSLVHFKMASFWRKILNAVSLGFAEPIGNPLVYEPSLLCPRSGI